MRSAENWLDGKITVAKARQVKAGFHIGFNFLSATILVTTCGANDAQVVRLASPDAAVGAPPDSCRPALTGEGGPVAWQRSLR
jgi:hypothetical protein